MTMPVAFMLAGLVFVAGVLGLFLLLGMRSGRGDLIAPPKSFGKREYGQRPPVRPAPAPPRPAMPLPPAPLPEPPTAKPDTAQLDPAFSVPPSGPSPETEPASEWRRERPAGHARLSEACYTAEQYAEREVKALLLQDRPDRAVRHVRSALGLTADEAEAYVERLARGLRV